MIVQLEIQYHHCAQFQRVMHEKDLTAHLYHPHNCQDIRLKLIK